MKWGMELSGGLKELMQVRSRDLRMFEGLSFFSVK